MKLFLDTNVVVDAVKFREPFVHALIPIFEMADDGIPSTDNFRFNLCQCGIPYKKRNVVGRMVRTIG